MIDLTLKCRLPICLEKADVTYKQHSLVGVVGWVGKEGNVAAVWWRSVLLHQDLMIKNLFHIAMLVTVLE